MPENSQVGFSFSPTLSDAQQTEVANWLLRVLGSENLDERRSSFPLAGYTIYRNGRGLNIRGGSWQTDDYQSMIYLSAASTNMPMAERIQVLAAFIRLAPPARHVELELALANAITKCLLGQYRQMASSLLVIPAQAGVRAEKMAFNNAGAQVAAFIGGSWYTPAGVPVEVGEGWVICEL